MTTIHLQLITPERIIFDEDVRFVRLTTGEGEIGILPHHMQLLTTVQPGELIVTLKSGAVQYLATGSGFAEVSNNTLSVLTDMAIPAEDIDERMEEEARRRAAQALAEKRSDEEMATTTVQLERSLAKLRVKRRRHVRP